MASLDLAQKARHIGVSQRPAVLFRRIMKNVPQILQIYDLEYYTKDTIKTSIKSKFYQNAFVKDDRVIFMLVEKGYMELEEVLLHYTQRPHLVSIIDGETSTYQFTKQLKPNSTAEEHLKQMLP